MATSEFTGKKRTRFETFTWIAIFFSFSSSCKEPSIVLAKSRSTKEKDIVLEIEVSVFRNKLNLFFFFRKKANGSRFVAQFPAGVQQVAKLSRSQPNSV